MVHTKSRTGCFRRISRSNALFGSSDGRSAELNLLETVDNLVKTEDEMSTVRDEQAVGAVETYCRRIRNICL